MNINMYQMNPLSKRKLILLRIHRFRSHKGTHVPPVLTKNIQKRWGDKSRMTWISAHPKLGGGFKLFFQTGWNHQLESLSPEKWWEDDPFSLGFANFSELLLLNFWGGCSFSSDFYIININIKFLWNYIFIYISLLVYHFFPPWFLRITILGYTIRKSPATQKKHTKPTNQTKN